MKLRKDVRQDTSNLRETEKCFVLENLLGVEENLRGPLSELFLILLESCGKRPILNSRVKCLLVCTNKVPHVLHVLALRSDDFFADVVSPFYLLGVVRGLVLFDHVAPSHSDKIETAQLLQLAHSGRFRGLQRVDPGSEVWAQERRISEALQSHFLKLFA